MHSLATVTRIPLRIAFAMAAACAGTGASAFDWQVDITPARNLFPALALSQPARAPTATLGGGNGLLSVRIRGVDTPRVFHLTIDTPGLRAAAVVDVDAAVDNRTGAALVLTPQLDWNIAALRQLRDVRTQTVRATLEGPGFARQTRRIEVRLHPLDDALYFVREGSDHVDLGWAFAAYVDPHDPIVDDVLALARTIDADFDADVHDDGRTRNLRRAGAVWAALEQHGVRYADGDPALSRGPALWSQRVRLLSETWRERRANCLDSSVLIASVLERLGLRTFIVLVPGHAFVGFHAGSGRNDAIYLETTLLGAPWRQRGHSVRTSQALRATSSFLAAQAAGRARWLRAAAKLDGRHGPDYAWIDISTARNYGIIPLAAGERASRNPAAVEPTPAAPSQQSGSP